LVGASNHSLGPAQRAEARDEWEAMVKAINTLTEEQRQVLIGRLILGYDVASCAYVGKMSTLSKHCNWVHEWVAPVTHSCTQLGSGGG
jgi:DNA-directed RNA polymerase sigma subunit (sigma70/sigma32)